MTKIYTIFDFLFWCVPSLQLHSRIDTWLSTALSLYAVIVL